MIRGRFTKLLARTNSKGTTQLACGGAFQAEGTVRESPEEGASLASLRSSKEI